MKKYIGVKVIEAQPMTAEEAGKLLQRPINTSNADAEGNGYLVKYPDGYVSWSPKAQFEKAYLQIIPNPRLKTDISISQEMVDGFIQSVNVDTLGTKTTVVMATLVNGFQITETSACVDPDNYSEQIGAEICLGKIKDKVWGYLGFLLQTGVGGVR